MATHFPLSSYHFDMSTQIFHEPQDVCFKNMYGRNCYPNGTDGWSGSWTKSEHKAYVSGS